MVVPSSSPKLDPQKEEKVGALPELEAEGTPTRAVAHMSLMVSTVAVAPTSNLSAGIAKPTDSCQEMLQ